MELGGISKSWRGGCGTRAVHRPELSQGTARLPPHPSFICVATCTNSLLSCARNPLCYEVLCWKTRTGNALVDPGALMGCPNLSKTSMGQLQLPHTCCRDITEMDGARIFADNHLLFSQTQLNILFLKMPWKLLIHSGFVCTILFSQSSPPWTTQSLEGFLLTPPSPAKNHYSHHCCAHNQTRLS